MLSSNSNGERDSMVRNKSEPHNQMVNSSPLGKFKNSQSIDLCKQDIDTTQELLTTRRKIANLQMELYQLKKSYALAELLLEEQTKSFAALREEQPAWEGCYLALESVLHVLLRALERLQKISLYNYIIGHYVTASDNSECCITEN